MWSLWRTYYSLAFYQCACFSPFEQQVAPAGCDMFCLARTGPGRLKSVFGRRKKKSAPSTEAPRETGTELPAGIAPLSGCRRGKPSGATPSAGVAVGWSRGRRALKNLQGPEARWRRRPWNQWRSADRCIVTGCIPPTPLCFFVWGRLWVCRPRAEDALPGMHWGELAARWCLDPG